MIAIARITSSSIGIIKSIFKRSNGNHFPDAADWTYNFLHAHKKQGHKSSTLGCLWKKLKNTKVCIANFQKQAFKGKLLANRWNIIFHLPRGGKKMSFYFPPFSMVPPKIVVRPMPAFRFLYARFGTIEVIHYFPYNRSNRINRFRNFLDDWDDLETEKAGPKINETILCV